MELKIPRNLNTASVVAPTSKPMIPHAHQAHGFTVLMCRTLCVVEPSNFYQKQHYCIDVYLVFTISP